MALLEPREPSVPHVIAREAWARDYVSSVPPERIPALIVAVFDSYESAMQNSNLPETQEFAAKQSALAETVQFIDLDVIDDRS